MPAHRPDQGGQNGADAGCNARNPRGSGHGKPSDQGAGGGDPWSERPRVERGVDAREQERHQGPAQGRQRSQSADGGRGERGRSMKTERYGTPTEMVALHAQAAPSRAASRIHTLRPRALRVILHLRRTRVATTTAPLSSPGPRRAG